MLRLIAIACAFGLAMGLRADAAAPPADDDGVTVVGPSLQGTPTPTLPPYESITLDTGTTIDAPLGTVIMVQRDASNGTYTIGFKPGP